ncbi:hypothetical protein NECAME_00487, partial [Necator americanus]
MEMCKSTVDGKEKYGRTARTWNSKTRMCFKQLAGQQQRRKPPADEWNSSNNSHKSPIWRIGRLSGRRKRMNRVF